jgi:hypothetical protein
MRLSEESPVPLESSVPVVQTREGMRLSRWANPTWQHFLVLFLWEDGVCNLKLNSWIDCQASRRDSR